MDQKQLDSTISLLQKLIKTPSVSRSEGGTADILLQYALEQKLLYHRVHNNIIFRDPHYSSRRPTLLLCSHHDTVPLTAGWTQDPYTAQIINGKLYGLGSNDAGGALVSLIHIWTSFLHQPRKYNLIMAAVAEEEISGAKGIRSILSHLPKIDMAIIGEPTEMKMAVAERGLIVIDAHLEGVSGHIAQNQGKNALYMAVDDIQRIRDISWDRISTHLPLTQAHITCLKAGKKHNLIPDQAHYVIDVRVNDRYSNEEILNILNTQVKARLKPRSIDLKSSFIQDTHPLVRTGQSLGISSYGSPTLSDMSLLDIPCLKMGPGKSSRSHTPDEFILISEIQEALIIYNNMLTQLSHHL